jgi:hypothetical protein
MGRRRRQAAYPSVKKARRCKEFLASLHGRVFAFILLGTGLLQLIGDPAQLKRLELTVEGTLAGQALQDTFAPRMEFQLDQTQLQLVGAGDADEDPLKSSRPGLIKYTHVEPKMAA